VCRNIRTLHNFEPPATEEEIRASALQYVRKISGFTAPSKANEAAFERAVEEVTRTSRELLDALVTKAPARGCRRARHAGVTRPPRLFSQAGVSPADSNLRARHRTSPSDWRTGSPRDQTGGTPPDACATARRSG
jgi:hypothetical protein